MEILHKVKDFLEEIKSVCKKYNMSISHEDIHGSFIINNYNECDFAWLSNATIEATECI